MRGAITSGNLEWFEPLMTHMAAELIREGAPFMQSVLLRNRRKLHAAHLWDM